MSELTLGAVLADHQWSKTSTFSPSHSEYLRGYVGQLDVSHPIEIGPSLGPITVYQGSYLSGGIKLEEPELTNFARDRYFVTHPEQWTNGYTSPYTSATYGLTDISMGIYIDKPSVFLGLMSEGQNDALSTQEGSIVVAITKLSGGFLNYIFQSSSVLQRGEEMRAALLASGVESTKLYNMDGGGTGAMALRIGSVGGTYRFPTMALRHGSFPIRPKGYVNNYIGFMILDDELDSGN